MRARDPEGAEDVLFRMAASGQAPDIHAYTILLRACVMHECFFFWSFCLSWGWVFVVVVVVVVGLGGMDPMPVPPKMDDRSPPPALLSPTLESIHHVIKTKKKQLRQAGGRARGRGRDAPRAPGRRGLKGG